MLSAICGASATIKCPSLTKVRLPSEVTYLEEGPTGNQCNSERCLLPPDQPGRKEGSHIFGVDRVFRFNYFIVMSMCFVSELMSAEHAGLSAAQASARDGGNYDSALTRVAGKGKATAERGRA